MKERFREAEQKFEEIVQELNKEIFSNKGITKEIRGEFEKLQEGLNDFKKLQERFKNEIENRIWKSHWEFILERWKIYMESKQEEIKNKIKEL